MRVSLARLPRLLMVLVLALAPYEARPTLAAVELFRGMAIQLSYRWAAGRLIAHDANRAALLWSVRGPQQRRDALRESLAVAAAVVTGLVLFVVSNTLLLLAVSAALKAGGASPDTVAEVRIAIVVVRLAVTFWRAVAAYRHDTRLAAHLPAQTGPRWSLDLLAASPEGSGYGRETLQRFLALADADDAEVVLHCDRRNVAFYHHHGFDVMTGWNHGHQLLMIRPPASTHQKRGRTLPRQQLQGYLGKGRAERSGPNRVLAAAKPSETLS